MWKKKSYALLLLHLMHHDAITAFTPTSSLTNRNRHHVRFAIKTSEESSSSSVPKDSKGVPDPIRTVFENSNDMQDFLDVDEVAPLQDVSQIVYSIDNEVALKKFIKVINEKDKGISPDSVFDIGEIVDQLIGKGFDTVEDAMLMLRRKMSESKALENQDAFNADALSEWNDPSLSHKPRVLVVGSGWAAHAFIKCVDTDQYRVLVVSPSNYFVFTPMLASSSVGTTDFRSIIESTRDANPFVKYLEGKGLNIDTENKKMTVKLGEGNIVDDGPDDVEQEIIEIPYDVMVYSAGVGPISSCSRTPGLSSLNVHFLKTVEDARGLRSKVISLLEKASQPGLSDEERKRLLTFVVVGGGPTGVEYCGELNDFLNDVTGKTSEKDKKSPRTVAPFTPLGKYASVKLLQGGKELLPMFDEELRVAAKEGLLNRGVEVYTSTRVQRIEGSERIVTIDADDKEESIDCGVIVWAAGTMPVKLTEKLLDSVDQACVEKSFELTPKSLSQWGRIPVDKWQRVLGAPGGSLIAIGDASGTIADSEMTSDLLLPQTAQVAAQQGAFVARLLNRGYDMSGFLENEDGQNEESLFLPAPINVEAVGDKNVERKLRGAVRAKPFKFLNLGQLAYTGGGEALSQVTLGDQKIFNAAGSQAFLLWRSVYIVKQVSTKTRILVLFDWFKTKLFGRDVTRM